ncbi:MAG: tetratricopeptide repeat-containing sensor histidine kinase [Winogradskyella sp.]|nr:MAG: tetratricopeptide repeat-containing sensor histidine kinase [Winogradskyella sp.]
MRTHYFFVFIAFIGFSIIEAQNLSNLDSINKYYRLLKDTDRSYKERLNYTKNAIFYSEELGIDSIKLRVDRQISLIYFHNEMYNEYVTQNRRNLKLAEKLTDTSAITTASSNLGSYYHFIEQNDSSYYFYSKALEFYGPKTISEQKVEALLNLADIQQVEKSYLGAEEDAVKAIQILNNLPKTEDRLHQYWSLYNLLAIISNANQDRDKTFEYYDKSIDYSNEMKDGFGYRITSINNKANAYEKFGDYSKALELFIELKELRPKYDIDEPDLYPIVLINIGKTKFESGVYKFTEVENYFKEGRNRSLELEDEYVQVAASLGLSKLYLRHDKKELARKFGNETLKISNKIFNNEYKMEALLVLSDLYEGEKGKNFLRSHIKLSDSLDMKESLERNKFARVKFDTDQIEAENEKISRDNFYLLLLSAGLLLTGILVYVVISQRAKNKELKLVQAQQEANEEIYNLMLNQQDNVEEARTQEKIRVSKELHDGVLGRLFGARLSLDSLNFSEGKEAMMNRANYIGQLKTIEDDIRKISHEMNTDFVSGSGFMDIVSELIDNQTKAYGFTYDFNYTDDFSWEFVPNKTKINIYRIIQESMQNTYKHAEAKHVKIDILRQKDEIKIYIVDDGKGFDTTKSKKGIGLKNMTSRVSDIGGKISFSSELGNGTTVKVKIPYSI